MESTLRLKTKRMDFSKRKFYKKYSKNVNAGKTVDRSFALPVLTPTEFNAMVLLFFTCLLLIWTRFQLIEASAASMSGVSDIFNSRTFVGDTKWLEKMNWVGKAVNIGISVGGMFAAVIVACQIMITVLYFGMPKLWDNVNQVKVVDQKKGLFSYSVSLFSGGKSGMMGNVSRGSDIFMDFVVLMLPNVKKYSENADDEYENFTTWIMSTALKKSLVLLAISMMMNGSLMQGYMVIVDGLGVFADRFIQIDAKAAVNKILNNGDNYPFSVGASGVGIDSLQGKVAESIYREVIKSSDRSDSEYKFSVGQNIERYVRSSVTKDEVQEKLIGVGSNGTLTDADWERVKIEVVLNGSASSTNATTISASDIGLSDVGKPRYFHIYYTLKSKGDSTYYFGLPDSE